VTCTPTRRTTAEVPCASSLVLISLRQPAEKTKMRCSCSLRRAQAKVAARGPDGRRRVRAPAHLQATGCISRLRPAPALPPTRQRAGHLSGVEARAGGRQAGHHRRFA
jgi:hypothetical protein